MRIPEAADTVSLALEGRSYQIDLSAKNVKALRAAGHLAHHRQL